MRTTFRGKLLLLTIVPLAVAQLVTLIAVMQTVETDVANRARDSLHVGAHIVEQYLSSRSDQLRTSVSVMAADFGLKEAVSTTDARTILSVLDNHGQRINADVSMLLSLEGDRIASTVDLAATRLERSLATAAGAQDPGPLELAETIGGRAYQFFAVPLRAPTPVGWIVVGFDLGQSLTERIAEVTGLAAALVDTKSRLVLATAGLHGSEAIKPDDLIGSTPTPSDIYLVGEELSGFLALRKELAAEEGIELVLLRSLEDAMAPYTAARQWLVVFTVALLGLVATTAVWISAGIAYPVRRLTSAVRDIISGQYDEPVAVRSTDEIGELASSFNRMRDAIAEREQRIRYQAEHDALTGLPNRGKIIAETDRLMRESATRPISILSIRLSRMNEISSTLGHDAADRLISTAAEHLKLNLGRDDRLGHIGTHDFVLVLPGVTADAARPRAEKVADLLTSGVTLERVNIALQSETGIATFPEDGESATEILRNAMMARTECRSRGDRIARYEPGRQEHYARQLRIVNDLRSAVQRGELDVHYQPKLSLPSGQVSGAEALVRWDHGEFGPLPPDVFVPAAEEAGSIMHLTRYVIGTAIRQCRLWEDQGHTLNIAVNISARDLQDEYLPFYVVEQLSSEDIAAARLTLEVTENSVMQDVQQAAGVLAWLRDIGVRIALDDFGTGHSSLAQIRNIPLDELKIDKSFVMNMRDDAHNAAIVRTTLALARELGLKTVAEGIEDEDTLRQVSAAGCNRAQGFFISKPLPGGDFVDWLSAYRPVSYRDRRHGQRAFTRRARR